MNNTLSHEEREALKQEIFHSLHCALPGNILSFDPDTQTASIQPAVQLGSVAYPVLTDVPVFMPVPFSINPGDAVVSATVVPGEDAAEEPPAEGAPSEPAPPPSAAERE